VPPDAIDYLPGVLDAIDRGEPLVLARWGD
jgi:hypothetical protein